MKRQTKLQPLRYKHKTNTKKLWNVNAKINGRAIDETFLVLGQTIDIAFVKARAAIRARRGAGVEVVSVKYQGTIDAF